MNPCNVFFMCVDSYVFLLGVAERLCTMQFSKLDCCSVQHEFPSITPRAAESNAPSNGAILISVQLMKF